MSNGEREMRIILPQVNGHYLRYVELIKQRNPNLDLLIGSDRDWRALLRLVWLLFREFLNPKIRRIPIIFLHGEGQVLCAFLSAAIFRVPTRMLFYYGFTSERSFSYRCLSRCALSMLAVVGVRLLYLEYSNKIIHPQFWKYFSYVPDPPLDVSEIYPPVPYSEKGPRRVLLAGSIDERKNYALLCGTLEKICTKHTHLRVELCVTGQQSEEANTYFLHHRWHKNIEVSINNRRISNEEFGSSILEADVVWAFYDSHRGSSGMFLNAVSAGKKVIFNPVGVVKEFGLELEVHPPELVTGSIDLEQWLFHLLTESEPQYSAEAQQLFILRRSKEDFLKKLCNEP